MAFSKKIVLRNGLSKKSNVIPGSEPENPIVEVEAIVIGEEDVDGSWRITDDGGDLVVEHREAGVWVLKGHWGA